MEFISFNTPFDDNNLFLFSLKGCKCTRTNEVPRLLLKPSRQRRRWLLSENQNSFSVTKKNDRHKRLVKEKFDGFRIIVINIEGAEPYNILNGASLLIKLFSLNYLDALT